MGISSLLLGGGIFFTVYGICNPYFRADKLFPGPHLFAGAAVCVLWALAAACVPFMEKGNETARTLHIGLNVLMLALYAWQLPRLRDLVEGLGQPQPALVLSFGRSMADFPHPCEQFSWLSQSTGGACSRPCSGMGAPVLSCVPC